MAVDRNRLEQEAMRFLQKGQTDKAIAHYEKLLRLDPRDRRIRQKLAELYLKVGRTSEAERFFREIAQHLVKVRQERAAISVVKQLAILRPDDAEIQDMLGDCYRASGFPSDARQAYEQAIEMTGRVRPDVAVRTLEKLIRLVPGEQALKVRLAELLEGASWAERAVAQWVSLASEATRLGRPDDRARFLEQAIRLRSHTHLYLDAAEARLAMGDARSALDHLQAAYGRDPSEPRTLSLLGRALEDLGQPHKARPIWMRAVALLESGDDAEALAVALRRAIACGAKGVALEAQLAEADRQVAARKLRLHEQAWAVVDEDAVGRVHLRASVQWRYGFPDRALETLQGLSGAARGLPAVRALVGELYAALGQRDAALAELEGLRPPSAQAASDLQTRLAVLRQLKLPAAGAAAAAEVDEEVLDDELMDDDFIDDELAPGLDEPLEDDQDLADLDAIAGDLEDLEEELTDAPTEPPYDDDLEVAADEVHAQDLTEAGQVDAAIAAWRAVLRRDPAHDVALMRIAELMAGTWDAEPEESPEDAADFGSLLRDGGTFAEISPDDDDLDDPYEEEQEDAPGDPFDFGFSNEGLGDMGGLLGVELSPPSAPPAGGEDALLDARALRLLGRGAEAAASLEGQEGLGALVLRVRCLVDAGQAADGLKRLSFGLPEYPETDPAYPEALATLVELSLREGRLRAAGRHLHELRDVGVDQAEIMVLERALALARG